MTRSSDAPVRALCSKTSTRNQTVHTINERMSYITIWLNIVAIAFCQASDDVMEFAKTHAMVL
jgi:hypothetical protein